MQHKSVTFVIISVLVVALVHSSYSGFASSDQGAESPQTVEPRPAEDEATRPLKEPLSPCPVGQVLDEETSLCVLEGQEASEEPTTEEPE